MIPRNQWVNRNGEWVCVDLIMTATIEEFVSYLKKLGFNIDRLPQSRMERVLILKACEDIHTGKTQARKKTEGGKALWIPPKKL